ncbi:response regulator transcription factor [Streptomyces sp. NPDC046887]|uniref:response regulator transcription factor n=1 Tax=Streptomyces sp. NPDC046887 TaxID=3155472 RepID=UPI0033C22CC9
MIAEQALTGEGTLARLRDYPELRILSPAERPKAEVLLVLAEEIRESTMRLLESLAAGSREPGAAIVLVSDAVPEHYVLRAVQAGLRSVIPRSVAGFDVVVDTIRSVAQGAACLPPEFQGRLVDKVRSLQGEVLDPLGMTLSGLSHREIEVLRLLSEGLDTTRIAGRLNYSERTIKQVISGVTGRFGLRNRTQAVAFALRQGVL